LELLELLELLQLLELLELFFGQFDYVGDYVLGGGAVI
jgi:hypothetical protein